MNSRRKNRRNIFSLSRRDTIIISELPPPPPAPYTAHIPTPTGTKTTKNASTPETPTRPTRSRDTLGRLPASSPGRFGYGASGSKWGSSKPKQRGLLPEGSGEQRPALYSGGEEVAAIVSRSANTHGLLLHETLAMPDLRSMSWIEGPYFAVIRSLVKKGGDVSYRTEHTLVTRLNSCPSAENRNNICRFLCEMCILYSAEGGFELPQRTFEALVRVAHYYNYNASASATSTAEVNLCGIGGESETGAVGKPLNDTREEDRHEKDVRGPGEDGLVLSLSDKSSSTAQSAVGDSLWRLQVVSMPAKSGVVAICEYVRSGSLKPRLATGRDQFVLGRTSPNRPTTNREGIRGASGFQQIPVFSLSPRASKKQRNTSDWYADDWLTNAKWTGKPIVRRG